MNDENNAQPEVQRELWQKLAVTEPLTPNFERTLEKLVKKTELYGFASDSRALAGAQIARCYAALAAAPAKKGAQTFALAARILGDVTCGHDGCAPFYRGRALEGVAASCAALPTLASAAARVDAFALLMGTANLLKCSPGDADAAVVVAATAAARVAGEASYGAEARRQACRVMSEAPKLVCQSAPMSRESLDQSISLPPAASRTMRALADVSAKPLVACAALYGSGEPPLAADRKAAKRDAKKNAKKQAKLVAHGDVTRYLPAASREAATARLRAGAFGALAHLFVASASGERVAEIAGGAFASAAAKQVSAEGRAATPAEEFPKACHKVAQCYGNSTRDDCVWKACARDKDGGRATSPGWLRCSACRTCCRTPGRCSSCAVRRRSPRRRPWRRRPSTTRWSRRGATSRASRVTWARWLRWESRTRSSPLWRPRSRRSLRARASWPSSSWARR